MIRLILLLLGAQPLRTYWWAFIAMAVASCLLGLVFVTHLFDTAIIVIIDIIGIAFVIEGVIRLLALAAIGFPNATIPVRSRSASSPSASSPSTCPGTTISSPPS